MHRTLKGHGAALPLREPRGAARAPLGVPVGLQPRQGPEGTRALRPHAFVCREWQREPERFVRDPVHETLGPYAYPDVRLLGTPLLAGGWWVGEIASW